MGHSQCPSTKGKRTPAPERELGRSGARKVWRSPEELADTPEFREFLEREFPAGASELSDTSRRDFVKLMGAGLAVAGAAIVPACRRPDTKIMAYSREVPEEVVPGQPLYYATSVPLPGGGAEGLLVRTETARPTKIEGNPLHPINRGKSSAWTQAGILSLYDPDRLKYPQYYNDLREEVLEATWDDFGAWAPEHFARFDETRGDGLAFIVEKKTSPSRDAARERIRQRWPRATWVAYEPMDKASSVEGSRIAFGSPMRELPAFKRANVVVSLDRNFLGHGSMSLVSNRGFASGRTPRHAGDPMSRLYAFESGVSETGAAADHRMRLSPARITAFAVALAQAVTQRLGGSSELARSLAPLSIPDIDGFDVENHGETVSMVGALADDLIENRGRGLIVVGATQPAGVHALAHALNALLGNLGSTVGYLPMGEDEASDSIGQLRNLSGRIAAGQIDTLVCVNTNPVYDAPADLDFPSRFERVPNKVTLSVGDSETVGASTWRLNGADALESWGDTEAGDGTIAPTQPMIAPLYGIAKSDIELLAMISGDDVQDGYDLVRRAWMAQTRLDGDRFETVWKRALHDGVVTGSTPTPITPEVDVAAVAQSAGSLALHGVPTESSLEVVFSVGKVGDGRYANLAWLQELPEFGTRVVWDNPVLVSPKTAEALKIDPPAGADNPYTKRQLPRARMGEITVGDRSMTVPVWVLPGMPDNCAILHVGYGRERCGHVGTGVGFNTYAVRSSGAPHAARGATLRRARGSYEIVSTQNHWSLEGRTAIVRQIDKKYWDDHADDGVEVTPDKIYAALPDRELNLAERMGELSHMPAPFSIYENPQNQSRGDVDPDARVKSKALNKELPPDFARGPQWGMSIDLSSCTGCGACTIACQSENNIPVVGKREVAKGREMAWIRVDRYFTGDDLNNPDQVLHQPVACVHCENAPCETVCPVNATVHGEHGTNDMAYNRCIGTRYCANNCPYKVRRFNFFDFSQAKYNGSFVGEETIGRPKNVNLIPPRLRQKLDEIQKMRMNPDVTVRGRGVMEKCTYCIQRLNRAQDEIRTRDELKKLPGIPDGMVQTACQQACPAGAIDFGDLLDPASSISESRNNPRSYMLLGYLNTRPRTTHMVRVNNPNPVLRTPEDPFAHHGHGGSHGDGHNDDHGDDHGHEGEAHGSLFRKMRDDSGTRLALRVIGAEA